MTFDAKSADAALKKMYGSAFMLSKAQQDAYEVRVGYYAQLGAVNPGRNARISLAPLGPTERDGFTDSRSIPMSAAPTQIPYGWEMQCP